MFVDVGVVTEVLQHRNDVVLGLPQGLAKENRPDDQPQVVFKQQKVEVEEHNDERRRDVANDLSERKPQSVLCTHERMRVRLRAPSTPGAAFRARKSQSDALYGPETRTCARIASTNSVICVDCRRSKGVLGRCASAARRASHAFVYVAAFSGRSKNFWCFF